MNYYEHHLGDYAAATAHLTWDEDMAYARLLRAYYHHEKPLPADLKEVCRLARATSPTQKRAVESVLREFFVQESDGWHQKRCDEEIARYEDKRTKAKGSANARWSAKRLDSERNANALPAQSEGNAPSLQSPVSSPKEERTEALAEARAVAGLDLTAFDRFVEYRAERKPAIKTISLVAAAKELAKFGRAQADVVQNSIANGYQGLIAPSASKQGTEPPRRSGAFPS